MTIEKEIVIYEFYLIFSLKDEKSSVKKINWRFCKYTKDRTDQEDRNLCQFIEISLDILIILTRTEAHSPEWQLKIKWLQTRTDSKFKFKSYLYREIISSWIDDIQLKDNRYFREVVKKVENIFPKKKNN